MSVQANLRRHHSQVFIAIRPRCNYTARCLYNVSSKVRRSTKTYLLTRGSAGIVPGVRKNVLEQAIAEKREPLADVGTA